MPSASSTPDTCSPSTAEDPNMEERSRTGMTAASMVGPGLGVGVGVGVGIGIGLG